MKTKFDAKWKARRYLEKKGWRLAYGGGYFIAPGGGSTCKITDDGEVVLLKTKS